MGISQKVRKCYILNYPFMAYFNIFLDYMPLNRGFYAFKKFANQFEYGVKKSIYELLQK